MGRPVGGGFETGTLTKWACGLSGAVRTGETLGYSQLRLVIPFAVVIQVCAPVGAQTPAHGSGPGSAATLAMAAEQQGNFAEAEKDWRAVVQQNPRDAAAYASLGVVLARQGKYAEAVDELKVATSLLATNAQAWNYLGLAYHHAGQPANAAEASDCCASTCMEPMRARSEAWASTASAVAMAVRAAGTL